MRLLTVLAVFWLGILVPAPLLAAGAADAILVQANAALASGQFEAARTLATSGLAETGVEDVTRSRLLVVRGLAGQALGGTEQALSDFTMALQGTILTGEERGRALFARGLSLDGQGRLDLAIGDYTGALTFAPGAPYALNNRANVYRRQGRFVEARRDYAAALDANTPYPEYPWFGLGQIAEADGNLQEARSLYSRALTANPAFALARERLAAIGAPAEGVASLAADTGVIVLRPPGTPATAPVILKPPPILAPQAVTPPVTSRARKPSRLISVAQPVLPARPGQGAPLRPAIVETPGLATPLASAVQLGAWRTQAEAKAGWDAARKAVGELLAGVAPIIVSVVLPGRGTFYRLRIPAQGRAEDFCHVLEARGQACLPVRD